MLSRPLVLLGPMGAGKSTIGRLLAQRLDATFVDLDHRIECLFGRRVAGLFERGEPHFRACERAALLSLLAEPGVARCVIAAGGGVVEDARNVALIVERCTSVYLRVELARLVERLSTPSERAARPLLGEGDALAQRLALLLERRADAYARASLTLDADAAPEQVVAALLEALARDEGEGAQRQAR